MAARHGASWRGGTGTVLHEHQHQHQHQHDEAAQDDVLGGAVGHLTSLRERHSLVSSVGLPGSNRAPLGGQAG